EDVLGERRPQCGEPRAHRRTDRHALIGTEELIVAQHPRVRVELTTFREHDEMTTALAVDEQHAVADDERSAVHGVLLARARSLQNAHTSAGVGAPQTVHGRSTTGSSAVSAASAASASCSWARSRKPNRNEALLPGERASRSFSSSL